MGLVLRAFVVVILRVHSEWFTVLGHGRWRVLSAGPDQYTDPSYRERFLRRFEFATFSPLLRVHAYQTDT